MEEAVTVLMLMNSLERPRNKETMLADAALKLYVPVLRNLCAQDLLNNPKLQTAVLCLLSDGLYPAASSASCPHLSAMSEDLSSVFKSANGWYS